MTDPSNASLSNSRDVTGWFIGFFSAIIILCLCSVCCTGLVISLWLGSDIMTQMVDVFPSVTPATTPHLTPSTRTPWPTPTVAIPSLWGKQPALNETFTVDTGRWRASSNARSWVEDGQFHLKVDKTTQGAYAWCLGGCGPYQGTYYYQADLAVDKVAKHGLIFGYSQQEQLSYYEFQINPHSRTYELRKSIDGIWRVLTGWRESTAIYPPPAVNTQGVYFQAGRIELHINGILVDTYVDTEPSDPGLIGVFVSIGGTELLVDNVLVYQEMTHTH